jgi:hypothetical protein
MDEGYFHHPCRFPKNVEGPFYTTGYLIRESDDPTSPMVWRGGCMDCGAPEAEAPELLAPFDDNYTDTYFVRQPLTKEEVDQAVAAAKVCCVAALRYGGRDPEMINALGNNPELCDYILDEDGLLQCTVDVDGNLLPFAQAIVDKQRAKWERRWRKKKWWQFWR